MPDKDKSCPQCGELTETLHEGCCEECRSGNQAALDDHNFRHDRWSRMSDTERGAEIKQASRRGNRS